MTVIKKQCLVFLVFFSFLFMVDKAIAADPLVKFDVTRGEYRRKEQERVYLVGKVVNIAQELQHRPSGADSQDALFSKGRQGLKITGGQIWTFVDNIKGQTLQWDRDYLGKYVKILGWAYHDAQYFEVDSFSMEGEDFVWNDATAVFESESDQKEMATANKDVSLSPTEDNQEVP